MEKGEMIPKKKLEESRMDFKARLQEKRKKKIIPSPPRYDEVFFEGVDWLNKL